MPIVISLAPGERGESVAHLGGMLARSLGTDVVVVAVTPTPWPPSPYGGDEEYSVLQDTTAREALQRAGEVLGSGLAADLRVQIARSVSLGVAEVARGCAASLVVLGSSASGLLGLVSLGGVANRLLHTLEVPVCFAPVGFRTAPDARVERITVGFGRSDRDSDLLQAAAARADQLGVGLRVVCFAVRPPNAFGGTVPGGGEQLVVTEWADNLRMDIGLALVSAGLDPKQVEVVLAEGGSWREAVAAVEWSAGDLLAIGASSSAVSRFLLGSHASKIVRNAPVPVIIVDRATAAEEATPG